MQKVEKTHMTQMSYLGINSFECVLPSHLLLSKTQSNFSQKWTVYTIVNCSVYCAIQRQAIEVKQEKTT